MYQYYHHIPPWRILTYICSDMNSESYSDSNPVDLMNHYAYPNPETHPNDYTNANATHSRNSPTSFQDHQFPAIQTTNHHGSRGIRNGARGAETTSTNGASEPARIGTRSRTGARVASTHASLGSPDDSREVERETTTTVTKGRTKRARTERREAGLPVESDSAQLSLVCRPAHLTLHTLFLDSHRRPPILQSWTWER